MAESPVQTQPLEVDDFSGGKTDNYIAGQINQFQDADNMIIKRYGNKGKLVTRQGSRIYDEDYYRIPSNTRLVSLAKFEDQTLFQMSARNVYTIGGSGWETVTGPTTNPVFSVGAVTNYISWAIWNKHLLLVNDALAVPQKVYDNGTDWVSRTLGLPQVDVTGISLTPAVGTKSYIYTFIRSDSYTIDTVTFREVSETNVKSIASAAEPSASTLAITGIPVLANSTTGNYNTTGSKVEIYRTTDNGTVFYKVGEVTNGTTSFNDTMSDATLQTQAALYTEGGVVDFEQCPPSKYVIVTGDTAFFLGIKDGSSTYGNRIRQSIPAALYASPADFYVDLTQDITGGGIINTYPVVFCASRCYRIEGRFDELGQGGMVAREISNTVGCVSHRSIVETKDGIFFAGGDGFYFTDGFMVKKISSEFNESYQQIVASDTVKSRIYGAYDPIYNRIWWACQRDTDSDDNDIIYVAHLDAPNIPFTTFSGGIGNEDNFAPSSLIYFDGEMLRGDRRGYLFKHTDDIFTDPKIDTAEVPEDWLTRAIIYDYRSPAFDFGTTNVRKWVPRIVVNADNITNLSLTVSSNNDNSGAFEELSEIRFGGNAIWGDADQLWAEAIARWNYAAVISNWRRFPSGHLRCVYKQVRMSNAYSDIEDSAALGTASSDAVTKVITLDDAAKEFTTNAIDYFISFAEDDYSMEWLITERTGQTITVADSGDLLTTGSARDWKILGYKKSEVLNLLSYVIDVSPLTQTQSTYRTQGS